MSTADFVPVERVRARRGRSRVGARTEGATRMTRRALEFGALIHPPRINAEHPRPTHLGQCEAEGLGRGGNPCPHVSCAYHLALDVTDSGGIHYNAPFRIDDDGVPDLDLEAMTETCALAAAEQGGMLAHDIGVVLGLTNAGVGRIERTALDALAGALGTRPEGAEGPAGADADLPDLHDVSFTADEHERLGAGTTRVLPSSW